LDATAYRTAEAEGGEFVSRAPQVEDERGHIRVEEPDLLVREVSASEGYQRWAATYDLTPNPLLAREERYLLPLLSELKSRRVLDLACGTGRWLERVANRGSWAGIGIDYSSAMLRVAGQKNLLAGRLVLGTCENLPFCAESFDLIVCSFALGHVADLHRVLCELNRVAQIGADVFISDLHSDAHALGWRVGFRDVEASIQIEMQGRSPLQIVEAFSLAGFECKSQLPLWLGEPERVFFTQSGKSHLFDSACLPPAIFVGHFRKIGQAQ